MSFKNAEIVSKFVMNGVLVEKNGEIWRNMEKLGGLGNYIIHCNPRRAENKTSNGYLQIQVFYNGKRYTCNAHDLIWYLHRGNIPSGMLVHHKNHDKTDNRIENLDCVTHGQHNLHHAKDRRIWSKGKSKQDIEIKEWHEKTIASKAINYKAKAIETYILAKIKGIKATELAKQMGVTTRTIHQHISDCIERGWLQDVERIYTQRETSGT